MVSGLLTDPNATEIAESEIALSTRQLEQIWSEIGPICVKRKNGEYGVALAKSGEAMPVWVYPRGLAPDPFSTISSDALGVERYASWWDAASAGWKVD